MQCDSLGISAPPRRWYRERWPWLLMAGPAIVVVAGLVTAWLAWTTNDGVVADDYYKRGLVINRDLERAGRATALRMAAKVSVAADGHVRVELSGADAAAASLRATFTNATRSGSDRSTALVRAADGTFVGRVDLPPPGRWRVGVETEAWRLPSVETNEIVGTVDLDARAR
jgi:uncharacterized protein